MKPYPNISYSIISFISFFCVISFLNISSAWSQANPPTNKVSKEYKDHVKLFEQGNKYSEQGKYKEAISSFQQAIKLINNSPGVHYNLANVYVAIGDYNKAVNEYEAAIKINPMVPDYHRNLGFVYALQQKGEMAEKKYDELKEMDPVQADVLLQWIKKGQVKTKSAP